MMSGSRPPPPGLVLTNDSASTWFNLQAGGRGHRQRYRPALPGRRPTRRCSRPAFWSRRFSGLGESDLGLARRLTGRVGLRGEYSALLNQSQPGPAPGAGLAAGGRQPALGRGGFYQSPTPDLLRTQPRLGFERAAHCILSYQRATASRTLRAELVSRRLPRPGALRWLQPARGQRLHQHRPGLRPRAATCSGATATRPPENWTTG
ncbi:MAG: hypothetical protein WKG07_43380 [Hymenobacter sp.]